MVQCELNHKILVLSEFKAFADDKIILTQKLKSDVNQKLQFVLWHGRKHCGKIETASYKVLTGECNIILSAYTTYRCLYNI